MASHRAEIASVAKVALNFGVPINQSTVNVQTGRNKPPTRELQDVIGHPSTNNRTSINSGNVEFKQAVKALGRRKLIMTALWTKACLTLPVLDAMQEGYKVYVPDPLRSPERSGRAWAVRVRRAVFVE